MPMHVEHIVPLAAGGDSVEGNLWLACPLCNGYKGANTHGLDPQTGEHVALYDPRHQSWSEHFGWSEDSLSIVGMTATGRATVTTLKLKPPDSGPSAVGWRRLAPADVVLTTSIRSGVVRARAGRKIPRAWRAFPSAGRGCWDAPVKSYGRLTVRTAHAYTAPRSGRTRPLPLLLSPCATGSCRRGPRQQHVRGHARPVQFP